MVLTAEVDEPPERMTVSAVAGSVNESGGTCGMIPVSAGKGAFADIHRPTYIAVGSEAEPAGGDRPGHRHARLNHRAGLRGHGGRARRQVSEEIHASA